MPASLMIWPHLSSSLTSIADAISELPFIGAAPMLSRKALVSSVASIWLNKVSSFLTIGLGVAAGSHTAHQALRSYPGRPASVAPGYSGATGERSAVVTASARMVPCLACCTPKLASMMMKSSWPPIISVMAVGVALYATGSGLVPVILVNSAVAACENEFG